MCSRARRAEQDFATLVSQLGSSLYFDDFLWRGHAALPDALQSLTPGLRHWKGIPLLRRGFTRIADAPHGSTTFASQSRYLIDLAAASLFGKADCVLATDLEWPPYLAALTEYAKTRNKRIIIVEVMEDLLEGQLTEKQLIRRLSTAYDCNNCDGLFLSSITYLGIRLPVEELLQKLDRVLFSVVDAAQSFGQEPVSLQKLGCDMILGGTQKWMRSGHPLRFAIVPQHRQGYMQLIQQAVDPHDPLRQLTSRFDNPEFGETIELVSLITSGATLSNATKNQTRQTLKHRVHNRQSLIDLLNPTTIASPSWTTEHSGILLTRIRSELEESPRSLLHQKGTVASNFQQYLRLSMPSKPFTDTSLQQLVTSVSEVS